jgi:hypothetical protein
MTVKTNSVQDVQTINESLDKVIPKISKKIWKNYTAVYDSNIKGLGLASRHLSILFDCLANPNLSATLATDQK